MKDRISMKVQRTVLLIIQGDVKFDAQISYFRIKLYYTFNNGIFEFLKFSPDIPQFLIHHFVLNFWWKYWKKWYFEIFLEFSHGFHENFILSLFYVIKYFLLKNELIELKVQFVFFPSCPPYWILTLKHWKFYLIVILNAI